MRVLGRCRAFLWHFSSCLFFVFFFLDRISSVKTQQPAIIYQKRFRLLPEARQANDRTRAFQPSIFMFVSRFSASTNLVGRVKWQQEARIRQFIEVEWHVSMATRGVSTNTKHVTVLGCRQNKFLHYDQSVIISPHLQRQTDSFCLSSHFSEWIELTHKHLENKFDAYLGLCLSFLFW